MPVRIVQKCQFYGILFTFTNILYNYYQLLDVLSVVSFAEFIYWVLWMYFENPIHSTHNMEFLQNSLQTAHLKASNNYKDY
jgi:hypothetical protein